MKEIDSVHTIHFDKTQKFLTIENIGDLPHNAYINKGVTGCGGTTLALTNDEWYVIAVPMVRLIENKVLQHPNVLWFKSNTTKDDVQIYIQNGGKKIMVTYDSLPKLIESMPTLVHMFRLLVDEVQLLIQYSGSFKTLVCNAVLDNMDKFKSVSFITATPTDRKYLPEQIKLLDYYEFIWEGATKLNIETLQVQRNINNYTLSFIINKFDTTDNNIYIFYNSINGVITLTKQLIKCLQCDIDDIGIMFADSQKNQERFIKAFGKSFEFSKPISIDEKGDMIINQKRINFISSMGFQGLDFYSNKDVISLIVADSKLKSMRYDAYTDIPQIAGRFRTHPQSGFLPENNLYMIWKGIDNIIKMTENQYEDYVNSCIDRSQKHLNDSLNDDFDRIILETISAKMSYIVQSLNYKDEVIYEFNNMAYSAEMSLYQSVHADFIVNNNQDPMNKNVITKLTDCFDHNTFNIPSISVKYKSLLSKGISYSAVAKEVYLLTKDLKLAQLSQKQDIEDEIADLLSLCPELQEHIELIGLPKMSSTNFSISNIKKLCDAKRMVDEILPEIQIELEVGKIYSKLEIDTLIYNKNKEYEMNIKNNIISKAFNIKTTSKNVDGSIVRAVKIISKKELNND